MKIRDPWLRDDSEVRRSAYRKNCLLRSGGSDLTGRSILEDEMVGSDGVAALASNISVGSYAVPHLLDTGGTTYDLILVPCSD